MIEAGSKVRIAVDLEDDLGLSIGDEGVVRYWDDTEEFDGTLPFPYEVVSGTTIGGPYAELELEVIE